MATPRVLFPPLDGLKASLQQIAQVEQQGRERALLEPHPLGTNNDPFIFSCMATDKIAQLCVYIPCLEEAKVSSIAVTASAPLGKYEAKG